MKKKLFGVLFCAILLLVFIACKSENDTPPTPENPVNSYEVIVDTTVSGGEIELISNTNMIKQGSTVTISVVPSGTNTIKSVSVVRLSNSAPVDFSSTNIVTGIYQFKMPNFDVFVTAAFNDAGGNEVPKLLVFTAVPNLTLTAVTGGINYNFTPSNPNALSYTVYYREGTHSSASAIKTGTDIQNAQPGVGGVITGLTAGTVYSVLVSANAPGYAPGDSVIRTATPSAPELPGQLTLTITPVTGATITADKSTDLSSGDQVILSITPPANREVIFVRVIGNSTGNQVRVFDHETFVMPSESVTVTVGFGPFQAMPILIDGAPMMEVQIWNPAHHVEGFYTYQPSDITLGGGMSGNPALVITLDDQWSNLVFATGDDWRINFEDYSALSFWTRCNEGGAVMGSITFGTNDDATGIDHSVTYRGEDNNGIAIGTEWKRVIVPLPNPSKHVTNQTIGLNIGAGSGLFAKTVFIDRVEFVYCDVVLDEIILLENSITRIAPHPTQTSISSVLLNNMKAKYTVDGQAATLIYGSADFFQWFSGGVSFNATGAVDIVGTNLAPRAGAGADYTLTVSFGGKTSAPANLRVNNIKFFVMDDCTVGSPALNDVPFAGDSMGGAWWGGLSSDFGRSSYALMVSVTGAANLQRQEKGPWNLTDYDGISFDFLIKSQDGLQGTGAIPMVGGNRAARISFSVREGTVWRTTTVQNISCTNYETWETKILPKSAFAGVTSWANITGWRMNVIASPSAGTVYYVTDLRATDIE